MNTKTMEGLVGARTNMNLVNTPMRVYKDARRRGDLATMERAMGYVGEFSDKAKEYKKEADKGMEEDAREAREKEKLQREEMIRKRKEEQEELEERIQENKNAAAETNVNMDTVKISEEGKVLLKDCTDSDAMDSTEIKTDGAINDPVSYTNTGSPVFAEQSEGISISV